MLKQILYFLIIITLFLSFTVCDNSSHDTLLQPRIRATFRSTGANAIQARVFIEGLDGNAVSGAIVTVLDDNNAVTRLEYNSSTHSYSGTFDEPASDLTYIVEVSTILSDDIISLSVPYTVITNIPNVTVFQNSAGNSVLNGQPLSSSTPIQIGWADSGYGVVYQVTIRTALRIVHSVSTEARTVMIPANTILPGSYLLEISAQKIHGDIHFRSASFYSASFITSPLVSFSVN